MALNLSTLSSTGLEGTPEGLGARYTLMSDWEAAAQSSYGNLESRGDQAQLDCYRGTTVTGAWQADGSLTDNVDVSSWTTTPTFNVTIKAASGNSHGGVPGAGFTMRGSVINQVTLNIGFLDCIVEDIELGTVRTSSIGTVFSCSGATPTRKAYANRVIVRDNTGTSTWGILSYYGTITNCLVFNCGRAFGGATGRDEKFYACTAIGLGTGVANSYGFRIPSSGNLLFDNCVSVGFASDWEATSGATISGAGCASGDSSVTTKGIGTVVGVVLTDNDDFVKPSEDNYVPTGTGKLAGVGLDLSGTFTDDITGATRTVPWDIGAYKVAGGPPPVGVKEMYVKDGGTFKLHTPYVKVGGTFQEVDAYVKSGGVWVPVHEK